MKTASVVLKEVLARGLVTARNPRNEPALVLSTGAFVYEGGLEAVETFSPTTLPTPNNPFVFPYPQLFILSDVTLLLNYDQIWELSGGSWVSKITGLTQGTTWTFIDGKNFVLLSNMQVTVTRLNGVYAVDNTGLPTGALGMFNQQALCGSPNIKASGAI